MGSMANRVALNVYTWWSPTESGSRSMFSKSLRTLLHHRTFRARYFRYLCTIATSEYSSLRICMMSLSSISKAEPKFFPVEPCCFE